MWRALVGDIRSPGSSESRLFAVAVRFGLLAKLVTVGLCTVLGVVATTGSARTAIAVIGSSLVVWLLLRLRGLPDAIALCGDVALAALVGLSAFWLGPPTVISWGARVAFLCAVVAHYDWPRSARAAWAVSFAAIGGYAAGTVAVGPLPEALGLTALLTIHTALARVVFVVLRATARAVDHAHERIAEQQRQAAVATARRLAEREALATLHDTACTTLMMVSTGAAQSDASWLPARARRDLDALRRRTEITGVVDLADMLHEAEFDHRVRLEAGISGPLPTSARAASAILYGVREAVVNVAQHAGTDVARLRAGRTGDTVWVELVDHGRGFDPAQLPARHRGIADSIQGRCAMAGATATVRSAPGRGTTIRWEVDAAGSDAPARPPNNLARFIKERMFDGYRAGLLCVVLTELVVACVKQIADGGMGGFAAWALLAVVGAGLSVSMVTGRPIAGPLRRLGLVAIGAASVVITPAVPDDPVLLGTHWYVGLVGWFVIVLLLDLPLPVIGVVLAAHAGWLMALVAVHGGSAQDLAAVGLVPVGVTGFQFAVAAALVLIRRSATEAAQLAERDEAMRREAAVAAHTHADHTRRYAELSREAVPLLTGLADGTLDPNSEETRTRCAIEAARMRVLFAERDAADDTLIHELRAAIDVAERRGLTVHLAVRGKPLAIPRDVRRTLIQAVLNGVLTARTSARITVLRTGTHVRLSSYCDDAVHTAGPPPSHPDVDISTDTEGGALWVQATWPPTPARPPARTSTTAPPETPEAPGRTARTETAAGRSAERSLSP